MPVRRTRDAKTGRLAGFLRQSDWLIQAPGVLSRTLKGFAIIVGSKLCSVAAMVRHHCLPCMPTLLQHTSRGCVLVIFQTILPLLDPKDSN
jgi:hypothetical protein